VGALAGVGLFADGAAAVLLDALDPAVNGKWSELSFPEMTRFPPAS
jgi:hypothetical protein